MPLGVITIVAVCCRAQTDITVPDHGLAELAGVAVTITTHRWRRNAVLSIVTGTAACPFRQLVLPA